MKKVLSAVAIGVLMTASFVAGRKHTDRRLAASANTRRVLYWVDPMHPDYRSDHPGIAPDCGMPLEPVYAEDNNATAAARLESLPPGTVDIDSARQQLVGIRLATVERSGAAQNIRLLGRVVAEDTLVYRINAGSDGFVRETFDDSVGVQVKKDQKLATCYGPEYLAIASGFLAATAGVPGAAGKDGNRTVALPGAVSKQGSSSIRGYTDRLRNLGMSEAQIMQMAESRELPESIDIIAPVDGFVLSRNISAGQHFDRSMEFYSIADLRRVWILADVLGTEAERFRAGTMARVRLANQAKTFPARVSNVLPQVDSATQTLKLRLEADNPGFGLRPDMFVDVELPVSLPTGLTVPADAVIDSGRGQRVFVERTSGVFEPREVQVGWHLGDRVEIMKGLAEGERVVSEGTFLVDSESRLKTASRSLPQPRRESKASPRSEGEPGVAASAGKVKDAACGMMIDAAKAVAEGNTLDREGVTYYFCSDRCKKNFSAQPEHYLASNPSGQRP